MEFNKFENSYNIIGNKLKIAREKANISQDKLSNQVHTCPHFLHLYILIQVLPPELFFYCEYSSRALTDTYILN